MIHQYATTIRKHAMAIRKHAKVLQSSNVSMPAPVNAVPQSAVAAHHLALQVPVILSIILVDYLPQGTLDNLEEAGALIVVSLRTPEAFAAGSLSTCRHVADA